MWMHRSDEEQEAAEVLPRELAPGLDVTTFELFYELEYREMLRLAIGRVDERGRAEELLQDAFERVLSRWDRLRNPGGYLRRVLVNAARSELRHRAVARRLSAERVTIAEPADEDERLLAALARLTPRRRTALVLRFFDDQSEAETARLMRCRIGTVKSLVSRGLTDLREVITP